MEEKYDKIVGLQLTMTNRDTLYIDGNGWGELESETITPVKEYKAHGRGFKYDGNTYINPKYIAYARPMMLNVVSYKGGDRNA